ncbi:MAG: hypothetical protein Q8P02_05535 [Candidatus Micrarchaeota archaeon]|nr:hypothetical protein [Candidatus Micrarchaeota archaeon]
MASDIITDSLGVLANNLTQAVSGVARDFVIGLASIIVVLFFLVLGWIVGRILVRVLHAFLEGIQLEHKLEKRGLHDALLGFTVTGVLSTFVKLVTYAVFLGIAASVVKLGFLTDLVSGLIGYVPSLIKGVTILALFLLGADYVTDRIKASKTPFAKLIGLVLEVFAVYTGVVIALPLILPGADVEILKTTFFLVIGAVAIALGLGLAIAIGWGTKDTVAAVAKKKQKTLERLV